MFRRICALVFSAVLLPVFVCFCEQPPVVPEPFSKQVARTDYFVKISSRSGGIRFSIINNKDRAFVFDRYITTSEYENFHDVTKDNVSLSKLDDNITCQMYFPARKVFWACSFNRAGDIWLSTKGARETGVNAGTRIAVQTNGNVYNNHPIAFHHLTFRCKDFYNDSVIRTDSHSFRVNRYFKNSGVIDSLNKCPILPQGLSRYIALGIISENRAKPEEIAGKLVNTGAILGRSSHLFGDFGIDNSGRFSTNNLSIQNGDISTNRFLDISGALSGQVNSFTIEKKSFANVGSMQVNPITNLTNKGKLHIDKSSRLEIGSLQNEGEIIGGESLDIEVKNLNNNQGNIVAKEALNLVKISQNEIKQQIQKGEERKIELGLLAGKTVKVQHHVDHYLNTIKEHRTVNQFGTVISSYITETGYIFQYRDTTTSNEVLPPEIQKTLAEAIEAEEKHLQFLRLSLSLLEQQEKALREREGEEIAKQGTPDSITADINELRSALKNDNSSNEEPLDAFLSSPRVYDTLSAYEVGVASFTGSLLFDPKSFDKVKTKLVLPSSSGSSGLASSSSAASRGSGVSKSRSYTDLSHVKKVESSAVGLSFESALSNLTLWRYKMERLADENPNAYKAMMAGWDAKVKATIALGAVDAVAAAPATGGASLAGFAGTLGISAAINHIIDVVATYGGERAAAVASDGDQRLGESFQKTFSYIAAMASQHGVRAALRWKDSSGKTTSKATPVAQQNRGETSKTSAPAQKNSSKTEGSPKNGSQTRSGISGYGVGKHWESLEPVNTPEATQKIGHVNKRAFGGGEIRTDGKYLYRFDRGHKTGKVHLERYEKVGSNRWKPDAECDPETGVVLPGSIEKIAKRKLVKW